jgi:hypothetical protein
VAGGGEEEGEIMGRGGGEMTVGTLEVEGGYVHNVPLPSVVLLFVVTGRICITKLVFFVKLE